MMQNPKYTLGSAVPSEHIKTAKEKSDVASSAGLPLLYHQLINDACIKHDDCRSNRPLTARAAGRMRTLRARQNAAKFNSDTKTVAIIEGITHSARQ